MKIWSLRNAKIFLLVMVVYWSVTGSIFVIAGDQFNIRDSRGNIKSVQATTPVGELTDKLLVKQTFYSEIDTINEFSLMFATYGRLNSGYLYVSILDNANGSILYSEVVDVSQLKDNSFLSFELSEPLKEVFEKELAIQIYTDIVDNSKSITMYYNNTESLPRGDLYFNGIRQNGVLCFTVSGLDTLLFGKYYFQSMSVGAIIITIYLITLFYKDMNQKKSVSLNLISSIKKYRFLLNQLVTRDFKSKYKRSLLGILWSLLNPLLTIAVQYIVFSNLFRFDIENYILYLLTGVVFFNFFTESTTQSMNAIVSNSSLITKVYVPKFIYPVSKVLSSLINLLLATVPLLFVVLITGTKITVAFLLLPIGYLFIILFSLGIGFILSSIMVFFRDTQFLWGIVIMLWMYLTPIFYPFSILPKNLIILMEFNPLYHFITFIRTIVMHGVSPEPMVYMYCFMYSFFTVLLGALFFKKTQDKFVINL